MALRRDTGGMPGGRADGPFEATRDDRRDDVARLGDRGLGEPIDDRGPDPPAFDEARRPQHREVLAGVRECHADGQGELANRPLPARRAARSIRRFGSVRTRHTSACRR